MINASSLFVFIIIVFIIAFLFLFINTFGAVNKKDLDKVSSFECGFSNFPQSRERFDIKFSIIGILFLIFDLELILLYPYSVAGYKNNIIGLSVVLIFFLIIGIGFAYELAKGTLNLTKDNNKTYFSGIDSFNKFFNIINKLDGFIKSYKNNKFERKETNIFLKKENITIIKEKGIYLFIPFIPNAYSVMDQFSIITTLDFSIKLEKTNLFRLYLTNMSIYLILAFLVLVALFKLANNNESIKNNGWSLSIQSLYATIHNMVKSQIGIKKGMYFFSLIFTLFMFIVISNIIGLIPYGFSTTAQLVATVSLSFSIWYAVTIIGILIHEIEFFSFFCPVGTPLVLVILLAHIELISYIARAFSLGVRLFANILAGHLLLLILAGFQFSIMFSSPIFFFISFIPLALIIMISLLELAVACIQAYVFSILSSSYIKDSIDLH